MSTTQRAAAVLRGSLDVTRWESYFTTRDGALSDLDDIRSSFTWRVAAPVRLVAEFARRVRAPATGAGRPAHPSGSAAASLDARLRTIAPYVLEDVQADVPTEQLFDRLCESAAASTHTRFLWLLFVAVTGRMPAAAQLSSFSRMLSRRDEPEFMDALLGLCGRAAMERHSQLRRLTVESERPLVMVDFIARHGFHSGVQRVAREISRRWHARNVRFVAMVDSAFRELDTGESARVVAWNSTMRQHGSESVPDPQQEIVVPWGTTVVFLEVPSSDQSSVLAALADGSGNRTVAVGYDTIPISSASFVHSGESIKFAAYLSLLRFVDRVVAISKTSATEFSGFSRMLVAQGLTGPWVDHLLLPVEGISQIATTTDTVGDGSSHQALPMVLAVGSHEPRKNHIAIIYAAERLWREGVQFSLLLMGGRGPHDYTEVHDAVVALRRAGRPIEIQDDVTDEALADAYAAARFSVYLSLHEGYGLPVAESLGVRTPVLTTSYGSTAEIAATGGCMVVDPRDDDAVLNALRVLVTDDDVIASLRRQIGDRSDSTWDDFARDLWNRAFDSETSLEHA